MSEPTISEQLMLEMVNRMRTNPADELNLLIDSSDADVNNALSFFNVDLVTLANQWDTLLPVAPLAWSEQLNSAAENHNELMIQLDRQSHQLTGEPDLGTRISNTGYEFSSVAENIFAFAESVFHGHAALAIDWGDTKTGIQEPPGHRINIMSGSYQEIGISILEDNNTNTNVGPLVITQDFGGRFNSNPWLVGVVYTDAVVNDDFYTPGEGIEQVTVTAVSQSDGSVFSTTTWNTGGYQLELPKGTYDVTFSDDRTLPVFIDYTTTIAIDTDNIKRDLAIDTASFYNPIVGSADADDLTGSAENDRIKGLAGNDTIRAKEEDDLVFGGKGRDKLFGQGGDDILYGDNDKDLIKGGNGDDRLYGGKRRDKLFGGGRNDIFVLETNRGTDIVMDFEDGLDRIGLSNGLTFAELTITQNGTDTLISNANTVRMSLIDIDASLITDVDFMTL